jgi:hypothetical protein
MLRGEKKKVKSLFGSVVEVVFRLKIQKFIFDISPSKRSRKTKFKICDAKAAPNRA